MFKAKTLQSTTEKCSSWITYQQIISNQRWVKIRHRHWDQTANVFKCMWCFCSTMFLFWLNPTLLLANCHQNYSDCLSQNSTAQTPGFNPGSPPAPLGAEWVTGFWRGNPHEALSSLPPPGPCLTDCSTVQKFSHYRRPRLYLHQVSVSLC